MALFVKIISWVAGVLLYGGLLVYCLNSANSDGSRAVAVVILCMFYIRLEFIKQEERHEQLLRLLSKSQ